MWLDPSDKKYWDHSFHELGTLDLPAMIDYITDKTAIAKLTYIGHSQGTTQLFAAMTIMPDYFASKLNGFIALAPVVRQTSVPGVVLGDAASLYVDSALNYIGVNQILAFSPFNLKVDGFTCGKLTFLCLGLLRMVSDSNTDAVDKKRMQVFMAHYPTGSSLKSLRHIAINVRAKTFQQFDYS